MQFGLDLPDLEPLYRQFSDCPVVSISDAQREPLPWANWQRTVYHGLPPDLLRGRERPGDRSIRGGYWADTTQGPVKIAFSTADLA